jgi:hypothetical protein
MVACAHDEYPPSIVYNLGITVKGNAKRCTMLFDTSLNHELAGLTSLEKILAWMQTKQLPMEKIDLIAQDEFCHDLYVPWQGNWLVFGLT